MIAYKDGTAVRLVSRAGKDHRFEWFRQPPEDAVSTPPIYMAFDCLYLDGRDLRSRPLRDRRAELARVLENDQVVLFPARRLAATASKPGPRCSSRATRG